MSWYEKAETIRPPPQNDDPILRWNTCVRLLERHPELIHEILKLVQGRINEGVIVQMPGRPQPRLWAVQGSGIQRFHPSMLASNSKRGYTWDFNGARRGKIVREPTMRWLAAGVLGIWSAGLAAAQQANVLIAPRQHQRPAASAVVLIRADVTMVLVPVTVMDALDRPVLDLPPREFRVFEDSVEQKLLSVSHEDGPVSVGFIFDSSGSMKDRIEVSIRAIEQFLNTLTPGDEFFLVRFSNKPELMTGFTDDAGEILRSLSIVHPEGWTALYDAIYLGIQQMKAARNPRRALFVLTDGSDNNSRYSESEVQELVRESDVRVYSIGLFERSRLLEKMAAETGASAFRVRKLQQLPGIVERLSQEFRSQYVLEYCSNNQRKDGKYRRVKVEVLETIRDMPLSVSWRHGYYAPAD